MTGILATQSVNTILLDAPGISLAVGLMDGNGRQVWNQFLGIAVAWILSIVGTLIILVVVDLLIGLRVPEEQETQGLDVSQHGEEGYNLEA